MFPPTQQRSRHRWYQFSLRALLIATAAAAGLAFAWAKCVEPYRVQRKTMAAISKLGGTYKSDDATGWVRYLDKNPQDIVVVDLAASDDVATYLPHLIRLPKLETLVVSGHQFGDEQLYALKQLATLRGLILDSTLVSNEAVEGLKEAHPDLVVYKSERRAVAELGKLRIYLKESLIHQRASSRQAAVPPEWLRSEVGEAHFAEPPAFVYLDKTPATNADLAWLVNLSNVLSIQVGQRDGSFLADVAGLPSLIRVDLSGSNVTDADLALLSRFPNLTAVWLDKTSVSDEGLAHVAALRGLEELVLDCTRITDAGLAHIAGLRQLQTVVARQTSMGDRGLVMVANLPCLVSLDIRDTLVTDDGLAPLARSKTLSRLFLSGTKMTDRGIPILERLAQLTDLYIEQTGISPEGAKRLCTSLPTCRIHFAR